MAGGLVFSGCFSFQMYQLQMQQDVTTFDRNLMVFNCTCSGTPCPAGFPGAAEHWFMNPGPGFGYQIRMRHFLLSTVLGPRGQGMSMRSNSEITEPGHDRRAWPRFSTREILVLYRGGSRSLVLATDQSGSGAFLAINERPALGEVVMLRTDDGPEEERVLLLAEAIRLQDVPARGVGVKWLKAFALNNPERLVCFLRNRLKIPVDDCIIQEIDRARGEKRMAVDFSTMTLRLISREEQETMFSRMITPEDSEIFKSLDLRPNRDKAQLLEEIIEETWDEPCWYLSPGLECVGEVPVDQDVMVRWGRSTGPGRLVVASRLNLEVSFKKNGPAQGNMFFVEWGTMLGDQQIYVVLKAMASRVTTLDSGELRVIGDLVAVAHDDIPGVYQKILMSLST